MKMPLLFTRFQILLSVFLLISSSIGKEKSILLQDIDIEFCSKKCDTAINGNQELEFEVNKIYPAISLSKAKLTMAKTLFDLNRFYKPSWVRTYISVEISTIQNNKIKSAKSINDTINPTQKDLMNKADIGTGITVNVQYIPENTLKHNDIKEFHFTFTVDPEYDAQFSGGTDLLDQYLKENAIDKIPDGSFINYDLAAIKFTINEEGQIINAHIFNASNDKKIDQLLLETICTMPNWKPASYTNGHKVKQEFALTVGNMENCMINLLNIRRLNAEQ